MYVNSWEDFEKAAERLYVQDPHKVCASASCITAQIIVIHHLAKLNDASVKNEEYNDATLVYRVVIQSAIITRKATSRSK